MRPVSIAYEKANTIGMIIGMATEGMGAGITMQQTAFGHACRPPRIWAQDFPFLILSILLIGCGAISFLVNIPLMILLLGLGLVCAVAYGTIPKFSKKALGRYEAWARLALCEGCGTVGTPDKKTFHYSDIQAYLRNT